MLALTVHEIEGYMRRLLEAGAMGYILKRAAATELVGAVRRVASGNVFIDPGIATDVISGFVAGAYRLPTPEPELTDRETQVVKLIALGHINREIAAQLNLSIKTIEVHKSRALEKLGMRSRAELVEYAMRRGWLQGRETGPALPGKQRRRGGD